MIYYYYDNNKDRMDLQDFTKKSKNFHVACVAHSHGSAEFFRHHLVTTKGHSLSSVH